MRNFSSKRSERGFTLVEVALALGVFAFSIVGIIGMIAVGTQSARNSVAEMGAVNLARTLQSDFRLASSQSTSGTPLALTPFFSLSNPTPGTSKPPANVVYITDNNQIVLTASQARYRLTIQQLPIMQYTATMNSLQPNRLLIAITWPAANSNSPAGSVEMIISVPR